MRYNFYIFVFFYYNAFFPGNEGIGFLNPSLSCLKEIITSKKFLGIAFFAVLANSYRSWNSVPGIRFFHYIGNDYKNMKATLLWSKILAMNECEQKSIKQFIINNKDIFPYYDGKPDSINAMERNLQEGLGEITQLANLKELLFTKEGGFFNGKYGIQKTLAQFEPKMLSEENQKKCNLKSFLIYFNKNNRIAFNAGNIFTLLESLFYIGVNSLDLLFFPALVLYLTKK